MEVAAIGVWLAVAMAFDHYVKASGSGTKSSDSRLRNKAFSDVKLDLNVVGAVMEFGMQSPLHAESYYGFAIDGDLDTDWSKCTVSNYAGQSDFMIDLRGIYPVDRVAVLSRRRYAAGAEVFVGNLSSVEKDPFQCGSRHPELASTSFTEFRCSTTFWIQYIRIRKANSGIYWKSRSLQICEVDVYHNSKADNISLEYGQSPYL